MPVLVGVFMDPLLSGFWSRSTHADVRYYVGIKFSVIVQVNTVERPLVNMFQVCQCIRLS